MTDKTEFGYHARALRLRRGLTLDQLALATGLSKGHLSRFERSQKALSIASLMRLADVLETSVSTLLGEAAPVASPYHLVRIGGRERSIDFRDGNYQYTALSRPGSASLNAFVVDLKENEAHSGSVSHSGEEAVFVLAGSVEIRFDHDIVVLDAGDFIQFPGTLKHNLISRDGSSRIYLVVCNGAH